MHEGWPASRLSSSDKPRSTVPSRAASLQYPRSSHLDNKCNLSCSARPASTGIPDGVPAALFKAGKMPTRHLSLNTKHVSREYPNNDLNTHPGPRHSLLSASCARRTRSTSARCCLHQPNPMPATRVKRWAGLTRTASDWDGLRKVSVCSSLSKAQLI